MKNLARKMSLWAILVMVCLSLSGCYTVLKRPGTVMSDEDRYLQEGDYSDSSYPGDYWYDPFYHWYYPDSYGRWRYYYAYPWWWNDYWYWHSGSSESGVPVDTDRHIWDRRRGPDWSSPPSSPSAPSTPSQPTGKKTQTEENAPATTPPRDQGRRTPDWGQNSGDRSDSDLKAKDRESEEDDESRGVEP